MEIVPATADRWDGLAQLFASDAGADPRWCWCMYWRRRATDFSHGSGSRNRSDLHELVAGGPPPGLLALDGDRVVGWVSVGPRDGYERIVRSRRIPAVDDRPAWSIACFVVARSHRGRGVARALLRGAIDHARRAGATVLEAYPVDASAMPEGRVTAPSAYTGTLATFTREGFVVAAPTDARSGGAPRVVVRLDLAAR